MAEHELTSSEVKKLTLEALQDLFDKGIERWEILEKWYQNEKDPQIKEAIRKAYVVMIEIE